MAIAREAEPVGSLSEVKEAGLDREDLLGIYRNMLLTRGVEERGHILYKQGKIPGSFYTGRGNEAAAVGVAQRDGDRRRRHAAPPRHGRAHRPRGRALADLRQLHGPRRRADARAATATSTWPTRASGLIAMVSHLPAMLPVATGAALAFRIRDENARRGRLVRRGRLGARRLPRVDELRRRPPPAGRLRLRQQPVGVLDPDAPRVRRRAHRRPRRRRTASRASSSTAPTSSPSTARRDARSRRRARAAGRR